MNDQDLIKFDSKSEPGEDMFWAAITGWKIISKPMGDFNALTRIDGSIKHFSSLREILHLVDRQDLLALYGYVVAHYRHQTATGVGLILWGDLKVLMDSIVGGTTVYVWKTQDNWQVRSWRLYTPSNVHVVETMDGRVMYMFVDPTYPLYVKLMEKMLKSKLEGPKTVVGNDLTTAEQLVRFIKAQIAADKALAP